MEEFQRGLRMEHTFSKAFRIRVFLFSAFSGDLAAAGMGDGHDYFAFERCLPGAAVLLQKLAGPVRHLRAGWGCASLCGPLLPLGHFLSARCGCFASMLLM